jgi:hypothetical protein
MTSPETRVLRQGLARLITRRARSLTDASAVSTIARGMYDELSSALASLISSIGVEALSARAFDLTQREYPAGERSGDNSRTDDSFTAVGLWLDRQASSAATDAAAAMFATFAELLTALIGEQLTKQYLHKAWPDGFSDTRRPKRKRG